MVDKTFYKNAGPFTLSKISEFLNSKYTGNKEKIISDIAPVDDADQNEICFVSDKYKKIYNHGDRTHDHTLTEGMLYQLS